MGAHDLSIIVNSVNCRGPVPDGIHVAWRSAFAFQSCHFVLSQVPRFILCAGYFLWQSTGKVEKFICVFLRLEVLRESIILVPFSSIHANTSGRQGCKTFLCS